jgi:flagellar hook assembly protein FlgD
VRTIEQTAAGGAQAFAWDGRDDQGATVPPGLYIAQIDAETDAADVSGQQVARLVGVVY